MLSNGQWGMLEPLIEACRPKGRPRLGIYGVRSQRSSGGIRTEPSGAQCLPSLAPGHERLRLSSAGHAWGCGSAFSGWLRSGVLNSG